MFGMAGVMFWSIIIGFLLMYFLPWIIALSRKHVETVPIFILNFFLGWSFVGWVVALVWACTSNVKRLKSRG